MSIEIVFLNLKKMYTHRQSRNSEMENGNRNKLKIYHKSRNLGCSLASLKKRIILYIQSAAVVTHIKHDESTLISWALLSSARQDNTNTPYIIYRRFRPYRGTGEKKKLSPDYIIHCENVTLYNI